MTDATEINYSVLEPVEFYDLATHRQMLLREWCGNLWLFFRHPDGQWVSERKATQDDLQRIAAVTW